MLLNIANETGHGSSADCRDYFSDPGDYNNRRKLKVSWRSNHGSADYRPAVSHPLYFLAVSPTGEVSTLPRQNAVSFPTCDQNRKRRDTAFRLYL